LDAHLKVPDLPKDLRLPSVNAQTLQAMEIRTWRTTAGDIDVLLGIPVANRPPDQEALPELEALRGARIAAEKDWHPPSPA
jgi:hypothetical protein